MEPDLLGEGSYLTLHTSKMGPMLFKWEEAVLNSHGSIDPKGRGLASPGLTTRSPPDTLILI